MKEIFKSLIGMTSITGLFFVFNALIQFYVPQLRPVISVGRGFVLIILIMGMVIITKSVLQLLKSSVSSRKSRKERAHLERHSA